MVPLRPSLVIADGDLSGLLACAGAARADELAGVAPGSEGSARRGASVMWIPARLGPAARNAARRHAELFGLVALDCAGESEPAPEVGTAQDGPGDTRLLLDAAEAARGAGLDGVVWAIHAGETLDLDRVARAVDRALLVSRLAALDAGAEGRGPIEVNAPYADFTDEQVAELALDMDLPVSTCWWWSDAGGAGVRARWSAALRAVGWAELPAATVTLRTGRAEPTAS